MIEIKLKSKKFKELSNSIIGKFTTTSKSDLATKEKYRVTIEEKNDLCAIYRIFKEDSPYIMIKIIYFLTSNSSMKKIHFGQIIIFGEIDFKFTFKRKSFTSKQLITIKENEH